MKRYSLLLLLIFALFIAACNGDPEEEEPTPRPTPTVEEEIPTPDGYPVETPEGSDDGYPAADAEAWLVLPAGMQCEETLAYPTADSAVAGLEGAGVTLLAVEETELAVCEACNCPTSAHYRVLVSGDDISTAISLGWQREP